MLGTGKTLEQAVAAFSKKIMASENTRSQLNTAIASAGAATISDVLHVECSACGTHTVTASATKSCVKCGTAIASDDWSDITLTAENDGLEDIQVEVEEDMPEEIVEDVEVEESEDSSDEEVEETVEDTSEEEVVEDDSEEETVEDEIEELTEESSDELSEEDFADLSDEELDELDRELSAMEAEAQDAEDDIEIDDEELLEDEMLEDESSDEWVDVEASDEDSDEYSDEDYSDEDYSDEDYAEEDESDEYSDESSDEWVDIEESSEDMEDTEMEDEYSDMAADEWVDIEESGCGKKKTVANSKKVVSSKKKVVASDYIEESEDSEEEPADEMSDQIEEIDLSENTELEASDEVTCALVKAGNKVHWQLLCNDLPVARLNAATIRGSLKALASNGIDTPEFEKALVNTVSAAGKRAITVAKELGFVGIKVPAAIPRRLLASVQTDLTRAKSQILASHLDQQTKKLAQQFKRDLRIVAAAINKGFYPDVVNPLSSRLTKTLAGLGISNAAQVVRASLAESFEPYFDSLLSKTVEFQQHPTQAKQAIASAIGQMAVLSEDDNEFEPADSSEVSEDYSAFMEVSSTTASASDMSVEKLRNLFR